MTDEAAGPECCDELETLPKVQILSLDFWGKLLGLMVGLSAPALVVGYFYLRMYYTALGAAWYVPNLSSASIIGSGSMVLVILLLGFMFALSPGKRTSRARSRLQLIASTISLVGVLLVALPRFVTLAPHVGVVSAMGGSALLLLSCGVIVRLVYESLIDSKFRWNFDHTTDVAWVSTTVLGMCLSNLPAAMATQDLDEESSKLPKLSISGTGSVDLRMVHLEGDTALVVGLASKGEKATFKLIKLDSTVTIQSTP